MLTKPLIVEIKFRLGLGRTSHFKLTVSDLAGSIEMLKVFVSVMDRIASLDNVIHAELIENVFDPEIIHEYLDS